MTKNLQKISRNALRSAVGLGIFFLALTAFAQNQEIRPITLGDPMPDFTLPVFQGGQLTLSGLKGKNVMIIFPRGYAAEGAWCTICNYKYAELIDLEKKQQWREKYNVEILVVLPYDKETVKKWVDIVPDQLEKIKGWKNPPDQDKLDEKTRTRMERSRKGFPKDLTMEKGNVPTPFPILIDEDRKLSKGLGIFTSEWGGSKVDQLMPSVFILDKNGLLQFKYIAQNTWDRPSYDYLAKILGMINKGLL
jgi:peroxiredoxin